MTRLMRFIRHLGQFICTLLMLLGDSGRYLMYRWRAPAALAVENLFLRKQLAPLPGAPDQTATRHSCYPSRAALARPLVRSASGLGHHAAGDVNPLALPGISPVLALHISSWTSTDSSGPAGTDPSDGS